MATKWLINSILLLSVAAASMPLVTGSLQHILSVKAEFNQTVVDQSDRLKQEQEALREIQRLEMLGRLGQLATPVTIPFDYVGGHIVISAQIQDLNKTLIVDSGIRSTLLDRKLVSDLTFSNPFWVDQNVFYGVLARMSLAEADFYNVGAFAVEFSVPGQPLYCLSDSGVIGASVMRHAIWQIDYQKRVLTVADSIKELDHVTDAIVIPFTLVNLSPVIVLKVGTNQTIKVLVDTGWGGSIHLASQDLTVVDTEQFKETSTSEGLVETLRGLESFNQKVMQIPALSLGDLTLENFPVLVSHGENAQPYSLMGNEFLEHFMVTLDWASRQLYLKPVSPISDLYPKAPDYGFQSIIHDHHLLITGLHRPSPAADMGLQIGDQILAINNDNYTHLSDEQFCAFLLSPVGDRYSGLITMTVARRGSLFTYAIVPEATASSKLTANSPTH